MKPKRTILYYTHIKHYTIRTWMNNYSRCGWKERWWDRWTQKARYLAKYILRLIPGGVLQYFYIYMGTCRPNGSVFTGEIFTHGSVFQQKKSLQMGPLLGSWCSHLFHLFSPRFFFYRIPTNGYGYLQETPVHG